MSARNHSGNVGRLLSLLGMVLAVAAASCGRPASGERRGEAAGDPAASGQTAAETAAPVEASPTTSDLDRPVADLLASRCEHDIPQYTCEECRYQVGAVKVDPALFRPGGPLDSARVARQPLSGFVELDGEVELDESRSSALSTHAAGVVRAVHVDLGSVVRPHQVLFELDCPEYAEAKAAFVRAAAGRSLADAAYERESDLYQKRICPHKDLLEAAAAQRQARAEEKAARERLYGFGLSESEVSGLEEEPAENGPGRLLVRAPFSGTVLERSLQLGAAVEPGEKLLLLGETSRMWVVSSLYERELALLLERSGVGEIPARVEVSAWPGRSFPGRLDRLRGTLDPLTRTAKARILVENPAGLLRAGMFARVRLALEPGRTGPAVPSAAVLEDEGRQFVFVRADSLYWIRRPVRTGVQAEGWAELLSGPAEGEAIVTRGAFLLKSDVLRSKMGAGCAD